MKFNGVLLLSIISLITISCIRTSPLVLETPVAEYKNITLTVSELATSMPSGITSVDSAKYAQSFVRRWLLDRILEQEAEKNLSNIKEVDQQVEEFRRELLRYYYMKEMAEQDSAKWMVNKGDVFAYYVSHGDQFMAKEDFLKYVYVKVSRSMKELKTIQKEVKDGDIDALEALATSAKLNYKAEDQKWVSLESLYETYPFLKDQTKLLATQKYLEVRDGNDLILFGVLDYCAQGSKSPQDLVYHEISNVLKDKKKKAFIENFENNIYNDNVTKGNIVIKK